MKATEKHLHGLYNLYISAETLCLESLKDQTMDCIQGMASKCDLLEVLVKPTPMKRVFENKSSFRGLRYLCFYTVLYILLLGTMAWNS